jgi:hypothetical protein
MEKKGLDRSVLKYIAAFFMVLDSLCLRNFLPPFFHLLTRFVAPLFAWLMVDGFFHTRSRSAYCKRLWLAAVLMQAGDCLSSLLFGGMHLGISDNIFLTLAIGFTAIWLIDSARSQADRKKSFAMWSGAAVLILAGLALSIAMIPLFSDAQIGVEGGLMLLPLILIAYFFHGSRTKQAVYYTVYCLLVGVVLYGFPGSLSGGAEAFEMFCINSDWVTFLVVPFMFLYNGEAGRKAKFNKYFFYVFYPLHLWVIVTAAYLTR